MSKPGHPDQDLILELALGSADATTKAALTRHLADCASCRDDYDDLADGIQQVLPAVPRVSPPPSFLPRVVASLHTGGGDPGTLGGARPDDSGVGGREDPQLHHPEPAFGAVRRSSVWLAVAAGLVGLAAGGAIALGVGGNSAAPRAAAPAISTDAPGALVTADGAVVGRVAPSIADGKDVLVIEVTDGPPGARYTCRLVLPDGTHDDVGSWQLDPERTNSWVVPSPAEGVQAVELVGESGRVWSSASP